MGFIGRAIGRRLTKSVDAAMQTPEVQAAAERGDRRMAIAAAAFALAGTNLDDSDAAAQLGGRVAEDPEAARGAIATLANTRTSYRDDRAYRLLTAAVDGSAVRPIDPAVCQQFLEEARLGRMSLTDAYEYLASLEPRLRDLSAQRANEPPRKSDMRFSIGEAEPRLVGAWAKSPHPILNTDLAAHVVHAYLKVTRNGTSDVDPTPFFERSTGTGVSSFGFGRGDTRPRARN